MKYLCLHPEAPAAGLLISRIQCIVYNTQRGLTNTMISELWVFLVSDASKTCGGLIIGCLSLFYCLQVENHLVDSLTRFWMKTQQPAACQGQILRLMVCCFDLWHPTGLWVCVLVVSVWLVLEYFNRLVAPDMCPTRLRHLIYFVHCKPCCLYLSKT